MSLDAHVRCTRLRDGKTKPHPLPKRLTVDDSGEPMLTGDPSDEEWEQHDQWMSDMCEHGGFLAGEFLGNITRVGNIRNFLKGLQGKPGPRFRILLEKVVCNGTHTGDWIPRDQTAPLMEEVDTVLHSSDILSEGEKEFFTSMKALCEASLKTGNPIVF